MVIMCVCHACACVCMFARVNDREDVQRGRKTERQREREVGTVSFQELVYRNEEHE